MREEGGGGMVMEVGRTGWKLCERGIVVGINSGKSGEIRGKGSVGCNL